MFYGKARLCGRSQGKNLLRKNINNEEYEEKYYSAYRRRCGADRRSIRTDIQSVDEYYSGGTDGSSSEIQSRTVTLEIRCDTVLKNYENLDDRLKSDEYVPPDGVILPATEYELFEGDTVFSVLSRAGPREKNSDGISGSRRKRVQNRLCAGDTPSLRIFLRTAVRLDVPRQRRISEQRLLGLRIE